MGPTKVAGEGVLTVGVNRQSVSQNFGFQPDPKKSAQIMTLQVGKNHGQIVKL